MSKTYKSQKVPVVTLEFLCFELLVVSNADTVSGAGVNYLMPSLRQNDELDRTRKLENKATETSWNNLEENNNFRINL